jgi:hypothetical protein
VTLLPVLIAPSSVMIDYSISPAKFVIGSSKLTYFSGAGFLFFLYLSQSSRLYSIPDNVLTGEKENNIKAYKYHSHIILVLAYLACVVADLELFENGMSLE